MESVAEAASAVRAARRRLAAGAALDGAALGALVGAAVGAAAWLVGRWTGADVGAWPLAGPVVGALAGAVAASRRGIDVGAAATALDAAAATDEAFVSSIAADADAEIRALTAAYAVERCPRSAVGRFLPLRAPLAASAAAVATAILAALVFVPRPPTVEISFDEPSGATDVVAGASAARTDASPRARVEKLRDAASKGETASTKAAEAVRKDLGAVTDEELRKLAQTLAPKSEAAQRALAALDRGDRAAATAALREALGGARSVTSTDGTGTATAAAPAASSAATAWSGASWPLRYDGVVRRWIAQGGGADK